LEALARWTPGQVTAWHSIRMGLCPEYGPWPIGHRDTLRLIATIAHESVMTRSLRHLKLAFIPPPIAPSHCPQGLFAFDYAHDCRLVS
jgi:hypothetical protein